MFLSRINFGIQTETNSVDPDQQSDLGYTICYRDVLTLKAPITAAADNKFGDIFPNFRQKYGMILHEDQQTILMKYHALFVIFEKVAKILIVCCKL